jgi:hypothetical protein
MATDLPRYEPRRISINKKRHYITNAFPNVPEGMVLPSVTTFLGAMAPVGKIMALVNWRKRVGDAEANRRTRLGADRGTWLHGILEDWFQELDIEHHLDSQPQWRPYFESVVPFLARIRRPILVESAVAWWNGSGHGYAGTLDMVAEMEDGSIALVDWKTSYRLKTDTQLVDYRRQLVCYAMAVEQMYNIRLDGAFDVISCFDSEDANSQPELQVESLPAFELAAEQASLERLLGQYFDRHYPGGTAFAITDDRG